MAINKATIEAAMRSVKVNLDVQANRREQARLAREHFSATGTLVVNLVSSPGSGKTSLLEATAKHWGSRRSMAVLVGDIATERDADRLRPWTEVRQLTTGGACHLEYELVERGVRSLPDTQFDFLFIENIGNLVCPASHDLGEHLRVVLVSVPEGDDKPGKYPKMFRTSQALVVTKVDLLPYVPFSVEAVTADARRIQSGLTTLETSITQSIGIKAWCDWLDDQRVRLLGKHV